jgi:hypothetical protein
MKLRLLMVTVAMIVLASAAHAADYRARLSGSEEVPARDTRAHGQAMFDLSRDSTQITFRLQVANIENVVAAHIHLAARGVNGGVVVSLYGPAAPGGGRSNGVLATGTITAADLTGALAGQPLTALLDAMNSGNTYVNVHTNDGQGDTNTGPGDFADGEIRGQIEPAR